MSEASHPSISTEHQISTVLYHCPLGSLTLKLSLPLESNILARIQLPSMAQTLHEVEQDFRTNPHVKAYPIGIGTKRCIQDKVWYDDPNTPLIIESFTKGLEVNTSPFSIINEGDIGLEYFSTAYSASGIYLLQRSVPLFDNSIDNPVGLKIEYLICFLHPDEQQEIASLSIPVS